MVDLRHEPALGEHETTSGRGDSRVDALKAIDDGLFRDGPWLSMNARKSLQELIGPDWLKYLKLADKLDRGDGDQSNDEQDTLYDGFPAIVDTVIDLFNMVSRRDEQNAALNKELDEIAGLATEMHLGATARDELIAFAGTRSAAKAQP